MALDRMLMKFTELFAFWRESTMDGVIWLATYLIMTIVGMGTGLVYAIGFALALIIIELMRQRQKSAFFD